MKTGLHQHTALRQDLRINPRLYQAMDLLYMPLLDLQQHLKQELLGNPFLELIESEDDPELPETQDGVEEKKETENNDEPNWEDILLDDGSDSAPPRDLRECLLLQLEARNETDTLAYRLVKEAFDDLKAHRWSDLGKRFGLDAAEVQRVADELAKLDPKPGLQYSAASEAYIIPDLVVEKIDGKYHVFLNDGGLPRLRISKTYQEIARDKKKFQGENKDFINQRLNSAHWMIQAIEQRRQTMLKVMNFIVDRQREFFEKGVEYLKPLTLREVADVINMHESTVSRVTNEKYVQTPRGLLPLKFFFSSGLSTTTGDDASARSITDALRSGADAARGRILVFYPADLQYSPADIPGLVAPILDGDADIVTGTKRGHYDKRFVSWVYNALCRWLFGVRVTDLNSVKAYRREVVDGLPTRPDWHRFMVVIAAAEGFRLREHPVSVHPRKAGRSKFGIGRIPVGVLDLVSVGFQLKFGAKPMLA